MTSSVKAPLIFAILLLAGACEKSGPQADVKNMPRVSLLTATSPAALAQDDGTGLGNESALPKYDLDCRLRWRIVADPRPELNRSSPVSRRSGRTHVRYIVDAQARAYCDPATCRRLGPAELVSASGSELVFYDEPGHVLSIHLPSGEYNQRFVDGERVTVTTGQCRRVAFSGFPKRDQGTNPGDEPRRP